MISTYLSGQSVDTPMKEIRGLSTDTKPVVGIPNGSTFFEINTGKLFCFDADNSFWYEIALGGGGGATPEQMAELQSLITGNIEDTNIASHNYTEGDYLIYNNVLYQVTTSIASGDTLEDGANISATNVTQIIGSGCNPGYHNEIVYYVNNGTVDASQDISGDWWPTGTYETSFSTNDDLTKFCVEIAGKTLTYTEQSTITDNSDDQYFEKIVVLYDETGENSVTLTFWMELATGVSGIELGGGPIQSESRPETASIYVNELEVDATFKAAVESCYTEPYETGIWFQNEHEADESKGTPENPFEFTTSNGSSSNLGIYPRNGHATEDADNVLLDGVHYYIAYDSESENYGVYNNAEHTGEPLYMLVWYDGWDYYEIQSGTDTLEDGEHTLAIYENAGAKPAEAFRSVVEQIVGGSSDSGIYFIYAKASFDDVTSQTVYTLVDADNFVIRQHYLAGDKLFLYIANEGYESAYKIIPLTEAQVNMQLQALVYIFNSIGLAIANNQDVVGVIVDMFVLTETAQPTLTHKEGPLMFSTGE